MAGAEALGMTESTRLTKAQKRWCELVNRGVKGSQAASQLWPKITRPDQKAYALRQLPQVQWYLAHLDAIAMEEAGVTRTMILRNLKAIADFDLSRLYAPDGKMKALHELDEETCLAIAGMKMEGVITEVKNWSKTEALKLLAQIAGMLKEQIELKGTLVRVIDMTGKKDTEPDG